MVSDMLKPEEPLRISTVIRESHSNSEYAHGVTRVEERSLHLCQLLLAQPDSPIVLVSSFEIRGAAEKNGEHFCLPQPPSFSYKGSASTSKIYSAALFEVFLNRKNTLA